MWFFFLFQNSSDQLTPDQVKEIVSKLKEVTIKSHKNREQRVSRYEADELDENEKSIIEDDNALDDAVYEQVLLFVLLFLVCFWLDIFFFG